MCLAFSFSRNLSFAISFAPYFFVPRQACHEKIVVAFIVALCANIAYAQSCSNLPQNRAAYQTCMLRVENLQRERERMASEAKQNKVDEREKEYEDLKKRAEKMRALNRICDANPAAAGC